MTAHTGQFNIENLLLLCLPLPAAPLSSPPKTRGEDSYALKTGQKKKKDIPKTIIGSLGILGATLRRKRSTAGHILS